MTRSRLFDIGANVTHSNVLALVCFSDWFCVFHTVPAQRKKRSRAGMSSKASSGQYEIDLSEKNGIGPKKRTI